MISPATKARNVVYAFGHGHMGLSWSATTGRLVASLFDGTTPPIDLTPFRVSQFGFRREERPWILSESALAALIVQVLTRHGLAEPSARIIAASMSAAERDGAHSHGLLRLEGYVGTLRSGWVDGNAIPRVADAAPALVVTDAANGFAQVAIAASDDLLRQKVRATGLAALCIHNSHHFGALWPDIEPFATAGFVALTVVNARSRIVAWGGRRKVLGTNPMAFAVPRRDAPPVIWDQASSRRCTG